MRDPFYIRLDHVASSGGVQEAIHTMQEHCNRLGIALEAEINGIVVHSMPGDPPEALWNGYSHCVEKSGKFAHASRVQLPANGG